MNEWKPGRNTALALTLGVAGSVAVGMSGGAAGAASAHGGDPTAVHAPSASYRQLLGQVSSPTYLEASVPAKGVYAIEYDIVGTAFFDTYLNGVELGYTGGTTGAYRTRSLTLPAGGLLVQVVGPEGSGRASVYLVRIS